MSHPKFQPKVKGLGGPVGDYEITAFDEDGCVWGLHADDGGFWVPLINYGDETPATPRNEFKDGRLWVGGDEVMWNDYGSEHYEWRDSFFDEAELARLMTLKEFGGHDFDRAVRLLAKVWENR